MTKFNEAIELYISGKHDESYELAKTDETLNVDLKKEQWLMFANSVKQKREQETKAENMFNNGYYN